MAEQEEQVQGREAEIDAEDDAAFKRAQEATGRPPAHEVSLEHWRRTYEPQADTPVNADPDALAAGNEVQVEVPDATVGHGSIAGHAAEGGGTEEHEDTEEGEPAQQQGHGTQAPPPPPQQPVEHPGGHGPPAQGNGGTTEHERGEG